MSRNSERIILENYIRHHGHHLASFLEERDDEELASFIDQLPLDVSVEIIGLLNRNKAAACLQLLSVQKAKEIVEKSNPLKADVLLRNCSDNFRDKVLKAVSPEVSEVLLGTLSFPKDTAGANMDTRVFTLPGGITVREAIKRIRKNKETPMPFVFVLNRNETLAGIVEFLNLIAAGKNDKLITCVKRDVPKIFAQLSIQSIIEHEGWLTYRTLPVVNNADLFLGAISLAHIKAKEDFEKERFIRQARMTSDALGDLYKIGLASFFRIVDEGLKKPEK